MDLAVVYGAATPRNVGLAEILGAVHEGSLPAFRTRPSMQLCDLWFDRAAVTSWLDRHQRGTSRPRALTAHEVAILRTC